MFILLRNEFHYGAIKTTSFMSERHDLHLNVTDAMYVLQLDACLYLRNGVWHWLVSLTNTTRPKE